MRECQNLKSVCTIRFLWMKGFFRWDRLNWLYICKLKFVGSCSVPFQRRSAVSRHRYTIIARWRHDCPSAHYILVTSLGRAPSGSSEHRHRCVRVCTCVHMNSLVSLIPLVPHSDSLCQTVLPRAYCVIVVSCDLSWLPCSCTSFFNMLCYFWCRRIFSQHCI